MRLTDWQLLGVHWLWWVAVAAGMLFVWSLLPAWLPMAGRRHGEGMVTLAIHSLLWVYPPADVTRILLQQPGVRTIALDPARGVARVSFDSRETSAARLQDFVHTCAHHCRAERAAPHSCPTDFNGR